MKLFIFGIFLISETISQLCAVNSDCQINSYCDIATSICKCRFRYYGDNCDKRRDDIKYTTPNSNIMTPITVGFSVGYGSIYVIGFTIIYYYFQYCHKEKEKDEESEIVSSKIFMDQEYQLTQNKIVDTEAGFKIAERITEENKKEEEKVEEKIQIENEEKPILLENIEIRVEEKVDEIIEIKEEVKSNNKQLDSSVITKKLNKSKISKQKLDNSQISKRKLDNSKISKKNLDKSKNSQKKSDNSYRLVRKEADPESNVGGVLRTEEENMIQKSEADHQEDHEHDNKL